MTRLSLALVLPAAPGASGWCAPSGRGARSPPARPLAVSSDRVNNPRPSRTRRRAAEARGFAHPPDDAEAASSARVSPLGGRGVAVAALSALLVAGQAATSPAPALADLAFGASAAPSPSPSSSSSSSSTTSFVYPPGDPSFGLPSLVPAGVASDLDAEESSNVRLFEENTPSVAFITNKVLARVSPYSLDATEVPRGAGSGFVWETDAQRSIVVTNFHVVRDASEVTATFRGDPTEYPAKVLGFDDDKDVAVLEVRPGGGRRLRPVPLGRSSALRVGQKVFAIGNPFGLDHTLTTGIVSGVGREIESAATGRPIAGVIQTDAAINPGNSGGPLLDSSGRLIGINTAIASPSGAFSGVGFAIPIDSVKGIVEQIVRFGRITRPVLGVTLAPDAALAQLLGPDAGRDGGVLVLGVARGSPAEAAGIRGTVRDGATGDVIAGDAIVGLRGKEVRNSADLYRALDECRAGEEVTVKVRRGRGGAEESLRMTLGEKVTKFAT